MPVAEKMADLVVDQIGPIAGDITGIVGDGTDPAYAVEIDCIALRTAHLTERAQRQTTLVGGRRGEHADDEIVGLITNEIEVDALFPGPGPPIMQDGRDLGGSGLGIDRHVPLNLHPDPHLATVLGRGGLGVRRDDDLTGALGGHVRDDGRRCRNDGRDRWDTSFGLLTVLRADRGWSRIGGEFSSRIHRLTLIGTEHYRGQDNQRSKNGGDTPTETNRPPFVNDPSGISRRRSILRRVRLYLAAKTGLDHAHRLGHV